MKYVGARISSELAEDLHAFCKETERSTAYWITKAIENLLSGSVNAKGVKTMPAWKRRNEPIKLKDGISASQMLIDDRNERM